MTWEPTERVREAAFNAWQNSSASLTVRERLDAVLVAVGPSIAAQALRDAAEVALGPERGIPFDHEHDVAIVSAWISEYADDQIEEADRG